MIQTCDEDILKQVTDAAKLFDTFVRQKRLRCDLVMRDWRFEFLAIQKRFPNCTPSEFYVYVPNLHNPDDPSEEFQLACQKIYEEFKDYNITPLYL